MFEEFQGKLNKYKLKTESAIQKRCDAIQKKYRTTDFFQYTITNNPITVYKNKKKGRPAKNETPEKIAIVTNDFSVQLRFDQSAFKKELNRCGYYPLITNKPEKNLSIEDAMLAHKNQYKCEHINRRAKSSLNIEPIYLHAALIEQVKTSANRDVRPYQLLLYAISWQDNPSVGGLSDLNLKNYSPQGFVMDTSGSINFLLDTKSYLCYGRIAGGR